MAINQNFKFRCDSILYYLKIYLQTKFQHQQACRFLDPLRFMWNLTIFSTKYIFPYIWRHPIHVNDHKIKSYDSWVKYDPIVEGGRKGYQI